MTKNHWDNYEDYPEYDKLDELPKRVKIEKPVIKATKQVEVETTEKEETK